MLCPLILSKVWINYMRLVSLSECIDNYKSNIGIALMELST